MFLSVDGEHSRISGIASQGGRCRRFLALIVDAPGSPASPPRGPVVDVSCIDSERSQISDIAYQGGRRRRFLC
jgi:hypothetical protein